LQLRQLRPSDATLLEALDSDPEVMRYINGGISTPLSVIEHEVLPRWMTWYALDPPAGYWGIERVDDRAAPPVDAHPGTTPISPFIGWIHLRPDRVEPNEHEVGYRLKRSVWGHGLATEITRALIDHAMRSWGYERIVARCLIRNVASRRVMEKVGMRWESEFVYSEKVLPGWTDSERRAVKYAIESG
jgi:RimJ/RimL family protein N-acetyltransferase